jgi:hypothetical protein
MLTYQQNSSTPVGEKTPMPDTNTGLPAEETVEKDTTMAGPDTVLPAETVGKDATMVDVDNDDSDSKVIDNEDLDSKVVDNKDSVTVQEERMLHVSRASHVLTRCCLDTLDKPYLPRS